MRRERKRKWGSGKDRVIGENADSFLVIFLIFLSCPHKCFPNRNALALYHSLKEPVARLRALQAIFPM